MPESVFSPEAVSADYPYTADGGRFWSPETPFLDPFVAIPAMAAVTERIRFFTNVLKLGIRDPLLVAKTVSSAAAMADGRVGLGVGLSWIPEGPSLIHICRCRLITKLESLGWRVNEHTNILQE